jgi:predicted nucleotidyltransferase
MSTETSSIGNLLFGQTRSQILALLLGAPDESFFTRQIARQIATSVGTVQRELTRLADTSLIVRSVLGSQVFYRANRDHPIFPELRALLAKTMGVFELLKRALSPLSPRIDFAFVYGSVARGDDKAASDIDLMVVGRVSLDDVLDALAPLEKQLRRPVNPTIYSLKDLTQRYCSGNHFLRSLKNAPKVFLFGAEDDFRKALATRVVQS